MRVDLLTVEVLFCLDFDAIVRDFLSDKERRQCELANVPVWQMVARGLFESLEDSGDLDFKRSKEGFHFTCHFDLFTETFTHSIRRDAYEIMRKYIKAVKVIVKDPIFIAPDQHLGVGLYKAPGYSVGELYGRGKNGPPESRQNQVRAIVSVGYSNPFPVPAYHITMYDSNPDEHTLTLLDQFLVSLLKGEHEPCIPLGRRG